SNKGRDGFPEPGYQQCELHLPMGKRRGAQRRSAYRRGNDANFRKTLQTLAGAHFRPPWRDLSRAGRRILRLPKLQRLLREKVRRTDYKRIARSRRLSYG